MAIQQLGEGQRVTQFSVRFYHILNVMIANGEYEKVLQVSKDFSSNTYIVPCRIYNKFPPTCKLNWSLDVRWSATDLECDMCTPDFGMESSAFEVTYPIKTFSLSKSSFLMNFL